MLKLIKCNYKIFLLLLVIGLSRVKAQSVSGTRGLIHIPTAKLFDEKTFVIGASYIPKPYFQRFDRRINPGLTTYLNLTFLPFMEVMFRYTHELNMRVNLETRYFPDRMMTFRFRLFKETNKRPSIVLGLQDATKFFNLSSSSSNNYSASYLVGTKTIRLNDVILISSLGYAFDFNNLISEDHRGLFGGIKFQYLAFPQSAVMVEYDSFNPIIGLQHLILNRVNIMIGLWGFDKITTTLSYRLKL